MVLNSIYCRVLWQKGMSGIFKRSISTCAVRFRAEPDPGQSTGTSMNPLVGRDFLNLHHMKADEIKHILWTAMDLKSRMKDNGEVFLPLQGKTAAMIFHKENKITRLSAELGLARLGGHAAVFGPEYLQVDLKERLQESTRTLASMADIIVSRVPEQESLRTIADESAVPVINGASNLLHPLQTLAIFMTIQEHFGYLRGCPVSWIGDSNSVLHSLMQGCAKLGVDLSIATPVGYEPDADITIEAIKIAGKTGASFQMGNNPVESVYRADVIITDTWFRSRAVNETNLSAFSGFQMNRKMLKEAGGNWIFMHCLPRTQEEVTDNLFYGEESVVWQLAENRMWTIMASVFGSNSMSATAPEGGWRDITLGRGCLKVRCL